MDTIREKIINLLDVLEVGQQKFNEKVVEKSMTLPDDDLGKFLVAAARDSDRVGSIKQTLSGVTSDSLKVVIVEDNGFDPRKEFAAQEVVWRRFWNQRNSSKKFKSLCELDYGYGSSDAINFKKQGLYWRNTILGELKRQYPVRFFLSKIGLTIGRFFNKIKRLWTLILN